MMFHDLSIENALRLLEIAVIVVGFLSAIAGGIWFVLRLDKRIDEQRTLTDLQTKRVAETLAAAQTRVTELLELRGHKIDRLAEDMGDLKEDIKKLNDVVVQQGQMVEMINSLRRDHDVLRQEMMGLRRGEGWIVPPPKGH